MVKEVYDFFLASPMPRFVHANLSCISKASSFWFRGRDNSFFWHIFPSFPPSLHCTEWREEAIHLSKEWWGNSNRASRIMICQSHIFFWFQNNARGGINFDFDFDFGMAWASKERERRRRVSWRIRSESSWHDEDDDRGPSRRSCKICIFFSEHENIRAISFIRRRCLRREAKEMWPWDVPASEYDLPETLGWTCQVADTEIRREGASPLERCLWFS